MCEMASLETRALFGGLRTAFWRVWGRLGGWECSQETVLVGLYASSHRGKILPTPIDRYCCISVAPKFSVCREEPGVEPAISY